MQQAFVSCGDEERSRKLAGHKDELFTTASVLRNALHVADRSSADLVRLIRRIKGDIENSDTERPVCRLTQLYLFAGKS